VEKMNKNPCFTRQFIIEEMIAWIKEKKGRD